MDKRLGALLELFEAAPDIPRVLRGLAAEAVKAGSWEEFRKDFLHEIKHGQYWHVTSDPVFRIDSSKGPRDMSSMGSASICRGNLMITSHLKYWVDFYGKDRSYAAEIDMADVPREAYYQVNRGFGNEFFVSDPSKARVVRVLPVRSALAVARRAHAALPNSDAELHKFYDMVVR